MKRLFSFVYLLSYLLLGACTARYAVVTDSTGNLYICGTKQNAFESCTKNNGGVTGWKPVSASILPTSLTSVLHIYVTDDNGSIYLCTTNEKTVSSCAVSNGGGTFTNPRSIDFYKFSDGMKGYVSDSNGIQICSVNTDGTLEGCADSGVAGDTASVLLRGVGGAVKAYVTKSAGYNKICAADSANGSLSGCADNYADFTFPMHEASWLVLSASNYYLLATETDVYRCGFSSDTGLFTTCTVNNGGVAAWTPTEITVAAKSGYETMYVTSASSVYQCALASGSISACTEMTGGPTDAWTPAGITTFEL